MSGTDIRSSAERRLTGRHVLALALGFLAVVLGANLVFIYLALDSFSGLSTQQAYRAGLAYNETLSAAEAQRRLGWQAALSIEPLAGDEARLVLSLHDRAGRPLEDLEVSGELRRPTHAGADRDVTLERAGPGRYEMQVALPLRGQWDVRVVARSRDGKRFELEKRLWLR